VAGLPKFDDLRRHRGPLVRAGNTAERRIFCRIVRVLTFIDVQLLEVEIVPVKGVVSRSTLGLVGSTHDAARCDHDSIKAIVNNDGVVRNRTLEWFAHRINSTGVVSCTV